MGLAREEVVRVVALAEVKVVAATVVVTAVVAMAVAEMVVAVKASRPARRLVSLLRAAHAMFRVAPVLQTIQPFRCCKESQTDPQRRVG